MTDAEKIDAVTAKLSGRFHIGQRVRVCNDGLVDYGNTGTVVGCDHLQNPAIVDVQIDASPASNAHYFYATSLEPAP